MLDSSSTTSTRLRPSRAAGLSEAPAPARSPRGRCVSSHASMARLRKLHGRPTWTTVILPAFIREDSARSWSWSYGITYSVVRELSSVDKLPPSRRLVKRYLAPLAGVERRRLAQIRRSHRADSLPRCG